MKGLNKKYPEQDFEFTDNGLGQALIISFDIQGLLSGILYAQEEGYDIAVEDNSTVKIGSMFQVRATKGVKVVEEKVEESQELESVEEAEKVNSTKEQAAISDEIDFNYLEGLQNTKNSRRLVDDLAKASGFNIDGRKFKTVSQIVKEFKRLLDENS